MSTYLHILDRAGTVHTVLNTRQKLTPLELAELSFTIQNPRYVLELYAYRANRALPGEPHKSTCEVFPSEFQGVGILSTFKDLNQLPRFSGNGEIKGEHIPEQIRGVKLLEYLESMASQTSPPDRVGNLTSWTQATRPIKPQTATPEQVSWATRLRQEGISFRKVAEMVGIPFGSLQKLLRA